MDLNKKYLPTLDSLRFIAATLVLICHIDIALVQNNYKKNLYTIFPFFLGEKSVVFFFVLSGFLITYLLLKEKEIKPINIKAFYLKRIFRIWPVYFVVIGSAFLFFNNSPYFLWNHQTNFIQHFSVWDVVLLCLISPNIVLVHIPIIGYATHTWSIGVEEQFYAIWPWVVRKKNFIFYVVSIILVVYVLSRGALGALAYLPFVPAFIKTIVLPVNEFFSFDYSFKIDAMAIGAIGAYIVIKKQTGILSIIFYKPFQIITYIITGLLLLFPGLVDYHFYCILFLLIILNVSFNDNSVFNLDNPVTNYLGKISYGIYMYHYFTMIPTIKICLNVFHWRLCLFSELGMCFVSLLMTIAISAISYHLMELNFLKLKNKILSRNDQSVHTP